jgi:hypothetical protein
MYIQNPKELVGRTVCDTNGNTIGVIDKTWWSWNQQYPGFFFGVRPNENARNTWFRGTTKLIPFYSDYIREVTQHVYLNRTVEQLAQFWGKTIHYSPQQSWPIDELVEKAVYDRNHCRVGTFFGWFEQEGTYRQCSLFLDPFLCETWNLPYNTLMPLPAEFMTDVRDTIVLNKTLDELRAYWQQNNYGMPFPQQNWQCQPYQQQPYQQQQYYQQPTWQGQPYQQQQHYQQQTWWQQPYTNYNYYQQPWYYNRKQYWDQHY